MNYEVLNSWKRKKEFGKKFIPAIPLQIKVKKID